MSVDSDGTEEPGCRPSAPISDSSDSNDCVEVAAAPTAVLVRDSKDPPAPLTIGRHAWAGFVAHAWRHLRANDRHSGPGAHVHRLTPVAVVVDDPQDVALVRHLQLLAADRTARLRRLPRQGQRDGVLHRPRDGEGLAAAQLRHLLAPDEEVVAQVAAAQQPLSGPRDRLAVGVPEDGEAAVAPGRGRHGGRAVHRLAARGRRLQLPGAPDERVEGPGDRARGRRRRGRR
ncbi:hypothetical protein BSL84_19410 [Streptomyces sp. TN58]|nr:hypothetical protein BSL84_19410 [Streptomyces sp. TN58]